MSSSNIEPQPSIVPGIPVISAPPVVAVVQEGAYADVVASLQGDAHEAIQGAVAYLEAAADAAKTSADVVVGEVSADTEKIAFKAADEHGFGAYLAIFKSSIDAGIAKLEVGISTEVHDLIDKGIKALKALRLP